MSGTIHLKIISLLLFHFTSSSAYIDGARHESCYDHSVIHIIDQSGGFFISASTEPCLACSYQLIVVREVGGEEINSMEVFRYRLGRTYELALRATDDAFLGYLVQARDNNSTTFDRDSEIVGTWVNNWPSSNSRPLMCNSSSMSTENNPLPNSVTHANAENFRNQTVPYNVTLFWTAPIISPQRNITFWFTIVQQFATIFYPVRGPIGIAEDNAPQMITTTTATELTTPTPLPTSTTESPDQINCPEKTCRICSIARCNSYYRTSWGSTSSGPSCTGSRIYLKCIQQKPCN